jgi:peptidase E
MHFRSLFTPGKPYISKASGTNLLFSRCTTNVVFVKMRQFHSLKIRSALHLVPFVSHYIETFQFIETFFHYNHFIPYTCKDEISQFRKTPSTVVLSYVYIQAYEIEIHTQGTHSTDTNEPLLNYSLS